MQKLLFMIILLINFLFIKSEACTTSTKIVALSFYSYSETSNEIHRIPIAAYIIPKHQATFLYFLTGNQTNKNTLHVLLIKCRNIKYNNNDCSYNYQNLYISLEHISDDDCVMKLEEKDNRIKKMLYDLSLNKPSKKINLTCTIERISDGLKDSDQDSLAKTSLFSIIFLSLCVVLTFGLCIGWFGLVYYRRFQQHRIKKQQKKELERCVRRILDKLPIIIFNSKTKDNHFIDDDSVCAICLEAFIDNEKLRKLICSHYFHLICIDPWLLTHQNCPLCNQNILNDSILSISARITSTNYELYNRESESINTSVVNNNS